VDIHVERDRHGLQSRFGGHSGQESGWWGGGADFLELGDFLLDFGFDFVGPIEVVGHGGVGFGGEEVGVLVTDFIDRPAVGEVVHDDLGDADAGQAFEVGGLACGGFEVGIGCGCKHGGFSAGGSNSGDDILALLLNSLLSSFFSLLSTSQFPPSATTSSPQSLRGLRG
jgi:hypothetical protein